jgi:hypothetical protein
MMLRVYAFLLSGHVQGVKMRRYIESAANFFGVQGYVINLDDGMVFGEAWLMDTTTSNNNNTNDTTTITPLDQFRTWIRGEWPERVLTNVKPTPVGTAYPAKARVETFRGRWITLIREDETWLTEQPLCDGSFVMIRGSAEAETLMARRTSVIDALRESLDVSSATTVITIETSTWWSTDTK